MDEETQETFIENILLPEKLKNEFIDNEKQARATLQESAIDNMLSESSKPAIGRKLHPLLSLTSQESMILSR